MSQELVNLISTGGAGVAVTVVTVIFLRFLKEERKELMSDRREERREFLERLDLVSNRLVQLTDTMRDTLICLDGCSERHKQSDENRTSHNEPEN